MRRRQSKSQETSARTTAESASSSIGGKEEASTTYDETKTDQKSVVEESIPSKEDSDSIPEAVNTTGDPNQDSAADGAGYGLSDNDPVSKSSEPTPDPNPNLPGETTEAKDSISIDKDPIPTDTTNNTSIGVTKGDENAPNMLNTGDEFKNLSLKVEVP